MVRQRKTARVEGVFGCEMEGEPRERRTRGNWREGERCGTEAEG